MCNAALIKENNDTRSFTWTKNNKKNVTYLRTIYR